MKKLISLLMSFALVLSLSACGNSQQSKTPTDATTEQESETIQESSNTVEATTEPATEPEQTESSTGKVLVVYFSQPETTDATDMTEEEDNSVVVIDGEVLGNTQYMAYVIQETMDADIFRIVPEVPYTTNHEALVDLAKEEQNSGARPAISETIENFDQYDTVFIGYPIWWSDMPQILYTFFDTYDFSGKTIIPFGTHGGSSFAGTPDTIQQLEPNATLLDGLTISRNHIQDAYQEIVDWVNGLGI